MSFARRIFSLTVIVKAALVRKSTTDNSHVMTSVSVTFEAFSVSHFQDQTKKIQERLMQEIDRLMSQLRQIDQELTRIGSS